MRIRADRTVKLDRGPLFATAYTTAKGLRLEATASLDRNGLYLHAELGFVGATLYLGPW